MKRIGENCYQWKGEKVGYKSLHAWITKKLGRPTTCEHCGKTGLTGHKIHWANKSHTYSRDLSDWIRLCVSCHRKYDKSYSENFIFSAKGRKNSDKQKEAARLGQLKRWGRIPAIM